MKITQTELRKQMAFVLSFNVVSTPKRQLALELLPRIDATEHYNTNAGFVVAVSLDGGPFDGAFHVASDFLRDDAIRRALCGLVNKVFAVATERSANTPQEGDGPLSTIYRGICAAEHRHLMDRANTLKHDAERQIGEQMAEQAERDVRAHARKVDQELAQLRTGDKQAELNNRVLLHTERPIDVTSLVAILNEGKLLRRSSWPDDHFIYLVPGSSFNVSRAPLNVVLPEGTPVHYRAHIDRHFGNNVFGVYQLMQEDLLTDDWCEVFAADGVVVMETKWITEAELREQYPQGGVPFRGDIKVADGFFTNGKTEPRRMDNSIIAAAEKSGFCNPTEPRYVNDAIIAAAEKSGFCDPTEPLDTESGAKDAGLVTGGALASGDEYAHVATLRSDDETIRFRRYGERCSQPDCQYCAARASMAELLGDEPIKHSPLADAVMAEAERTIARGDHVFGTTPSAYAHERAAAVPYPGVPGTLHS